MHVSLLLRLMSTSPVLNHPLLVVAYVIGQRAPVRGGVHSSGFNSHTQIIVDIMQLFVRFAEKDMRGGSNR